MAVSRAGQNEVIFIGTNAAGRSVTRSVGYFANSSVPTVTQAVSLAQSYQKLSKMKIATVRLAVITEATMSST